MNIPTRTKLKNRIVKPFLKAFVIGVILITTLNLCNFSQQALYSNFGQRPMIFSLASLASMALLIYFLAVISIKIEDSRLSTYKRSKTAWFWGLAGLASACLAISLVVTIIQMFATSFLQFIPAG